MAVVQRSQLSSSSTGIIASRQELGIKKTGTSVSVADNPRARLMYYLNCVSTVLQIDDNPNLSRFTNHSRHSNLDDDDIDALLVLVILFSPDELIGKVFFQSEDCGSSSNEFYEISQVRHMFAVTESIVVGGQRKQVSKIMLFETQWLVRNYIEPMQSFQTRLGRIATELKSSSASASRTRQKKGCCTIL